MDRVITSRAPVRCALGAWSGATAAALLVALRAATAVAQTAPETTAADDTETTEEAAAPPEATGPEPASPAWDWRQVLSAPRILNRFTAVTVDAGNVDHVLVGTEEGTIIRTYDGGRSWEEREVSPNVVARRSLALRAPSLEALNRHPVGLGAARLASQGNFGGTPPSGGTGAGTVGSNNGSSPPPPGQPHGGPAGHANSTATFLASSVLPRDDEISPVRRIVFCPGGRYPLIVATSREVYGSLDDGSTFMRIYAAPNGLSSTAAEPPVTSVACSPTNPNEIIIAVSSLLGILRSTDGGSIFLNNVTGAPAGGTNFVTFDEAGARVDPSQPPVLLFSADSALYVGDAASAEGVQFAYPDYDDPSLGTWETINWITTTSTGQIWMTTENRADSRGGVRYSPDGGGTWRAADRALFDRKVSLCVVEGTTAQGTPRVAVALEDSVYSSDDGGRSFQPFFLGITRRAITQMATGPARAGQPSRWWITAGGELWATSPATRHAGLGEDTVDARWARDRIRATPTLGESIDEAWHATHMFVNVQRLWASRALIPRVSATFYSYVPNYLSSRIETGAFNILDLRRWTQTAQSLIFSASWNFGDLLPSAGGADAVSAIYNIRQEVEFVVEDAWHERMLLLRRIARGELDRLETDVARERIDVLEAALETWSSRRHR